MTRLKGFTLIELVMVLAVASILGVYIAMRGYSPSDSTLLSQTQKMAVDLRHVQTLASTWGTSLVVNASTNGNIYSVTCKAGSVASVCGGTPGTTLVTNPSTGLPFKVTLQKGVQFKTVSNNTLTFNSLGQPNAGATYVLNSDNGNNTVTVEVTTGRITP